jgi:hypothetical protein
MPLAGRLRLLVRRGHLVQFSDTADQHYGICVHASNRLISVTYPDGGQRGYLYNEPAYTPANQL